MISLFEKHCSHKGCKNKAHSRGLCQSHYWHFRKKNPEKVMRYEKHIGKDVNTYTIWKLMKSRCHNEYATGYKRYGAKGIKVCDEWFDSYDAFVRDMGNRPIGKQLDRIDGRKGYSKENCRWVTPAENNRNRASNKLNMQKAIEIRMSNLSVVTLADRYNVSIDTINNVRRGRSWTT